MPERRRDLIFVATLLAGAIAALTYGYSRPGATTLVVSALAASTLVRWHRRPDLVLGATGLILGPLVEWVATASGLWTYAAPSMAGLPLWVLPMWWIYPLAVTRVVTALTARQPVPGPPAISIALIAAVVCWLCAFGAERPILALMGTLALLGVFLYQHHSWTDAMTLVVCGVIGPGAELFPVLAGAWRYPDGPLFGLPIWLPTGYGVFGVALIHLGLAFAARATRFQPRSQSTARHNQPTPQPM